MSGMLVDTAANTNRSMCGRCQKPILDQDPCLGHVHIEYSPNKTTHNHFAHRMCFLQHVHESGADLAGRVCCTHCDTRLTPTADVENARHAMHRFVAEVKNQSPANGNLELTMNGPRLRYSKAKADLVFKRAVLAAVNARDQSSFRLAVRRITLSECRRTESQKTAKVMEKFDSESSALEQSADAVFSFFVRANLRKSVQDLQSELRKIDPGHFTRLCWKVGDLSRSVLYNFSH